MTMKNEAENERDQKVLKQTWIQDAETAVNKGSYKTARAIYENATEHLKGKKSVWLRLAEIEAKYGTKQSLDEVLR